MNSISSPFGQNFLLALSSIGQFILIFLREFYWLLILIFLAHLFFNYRKTYLEKEAKKKKEPQEWSLLEIILTKAIEQSPRAMEDFFNGLSFVKKGYLSLEIVGLKHSIRFFLYCPAEYKKLIESLLFSQYPTIEIIEKEDYLSSLPPNLPNKNYDLWGTEFVLEKNSAYPIKTYPFFKEEKSEGFSDPLNNLAELINNLSEKEHYFIQIIVQPLDKEKQEKWVKESKEEEDIVLGKKVKPKPVSTKDWWLAFFINLLTGIFREPVWPDVSEAPAAPSSPSFSQQETAHLIEKKIAKKGFETGIRVIYLSPKDAFNEINTLSFLAFFNQFDFQNLNSFKVNDLVTTEYSGRLFAERRCFLKKRSLYQQLLKREKAFTSFILNSEELATIYHLPTGQLKVSFIQPSGALFKKGEPPPYLPS